MKTLRDPAIVVAEVAVEEQLGESEEGVKRSAQFMAYRRHKRFVARRGSLRHLDQPPLINRRQAPFR